MRWWAGATVVWSLVFAAPHLYWAAGGRGGLGAQVAAADEALAQPWFYAYNLATVVLALVGVAVAVALARGRELDRGHRALRAMLWAASGLLLARGAVGMGQLVLRLATGRADSPAVLVAVEVLFPVGGVLLGGLAASSRRLGRGKRD